MRAPPCSVVLAGKCPILYILLAGSHSFEKPSPALPPEEVVLPHCTGMSLIPSCFAHHWQPEKIHYMGVSLVPAHAAAVRARTSSSQGSSPLPGFLSLSNSQSCNGACSFQLLLLLPQSQRRDLGPRG